MTTARPLPPPEEVTLTFYPGGRPLKIRRWMAEEWTEAHHAAKGGRPAIVTVPMPLTDGVYIQDPDKWRRIVAADEAATIAQWHLDQLIGAHRAAPGFRPMPKGPN
jgi:hypothetical protein